MDSILSFIFSAHMRVKERRVSCSELSFICFDPILAGTQESSCLASGCLNGDISDMSSLSRNSKLQNSASATFPSKLDFDDFDMDDELDPVMQEKIDRFAYLD